MTASGGNFIGSEVNRSKRAPQWGVATTEVAERICMTSAEFTAFYPQFAGFTPAVVLSEYIRQANCRFSSFTEEDAEEARRLYTAHKLTMYARMALPEGDTPSKSAIAAAASQARQKIASKKVGEVAVTYSSGTSSSSVSVQTDLTDLTETDFGMQLLGLIKMYARSVYVP